MDRSPIKNPASFKRNSRPKESLSPAVALSERVNEIHRVVVERKPYNEIASGKITQIVLFAQSRKSMLRVKFDPRAGRKEFAFPTLHIDGPDFTGPGKKILKQMPMQLLEFFEITRMRNEIVLVNLQSSHEVKICLSYRQGFRSHRSYEVMQHPSSRVYIWVNGRQARIAHA